MTKKKQSTKKEDKYTKEDIERAERIIGDEMSKCSEEIWNVLMKFSLTPAQYYGIFTSIMLSISSDISEIASEQTHVCTGCNEKYNYNTNKTEHNAKEAQLAMYT